MQVFRPVPFSVTKQQKQPSGDVVESKIVYRKMFTRVSSEMYILISSLTASFLPKCVETIVSNFNLPWPFVRVSLRGVCRSVGSCLVYCVMFLYRRANHLLTWSAVGKTFQLPSSPPSRKGITFGFTAHLHSCVSVQVFIVCCTPPSKVLFAFDRSVIPMQKKKDP